MKVSDIPQNIVKPPTPDNWKNAARYGWQIDQESCSHGPMNDAVRVAAGHMGQQRRPWADTSKAATYGQGWKLAEEGNTSFAEKLGQ